MAEGFVGFLAMWMGGGGTDGAVAPAPEIVRELTDISVAFSADMGPIHLLPHEWRQIRRIRAIAKQDEKMALAALRGWRRRTLEARRAMKMNREAFR